LAAYTLHPNPAIFGAFDNTQLVGIVGFDREQREKMRHKGLIWDMYVAPEYGGRGFGRQLLRAAVAFARTVSGLEHVLLTVVATNANARGLYVSEGFETIGLEPQTIKWAGQYFDEETMRHSL
jgi:ribosomal protein S18 acetylase RimI-like enzyme